MQSNPSVRLSTSFDAFGIYVHKLFSLWTISFTVKWAVLKDKLTTLLEKQRQHEFNITKMTSLMGHTLLLLNLDSLLLGPISSLHLPWQIPALTVRQHMPINFVLPLWWFQIDSTGKFQDWNEISIESYNTDLYQPPWWDPHLTSKTTSIDSSYLISIISLKTQKAFSFATDVSRHIMIKLITPTFSLSVQFNETSSSLMEEVIHYLSLSTTHWAQCLFIFSANI